MIGSDVLFWESVVTPRYTKSAHLPANLIAFFASLHALGAHPAILPAAIVYLAGNTVGSFAPTPGGIGAIEAVLTAGLTAIGVPAHEAIPAVLIFRIATFWLPILAGWLSYTVLQRQGTL